MIAEGTYAAQLVKNDGEWLQFSRASTGNAQVLLSFELADGSRIQGFFAITPAAAEYTLAKLHSCGFTGASFRAMAGQTPNGKVELVIEHQEYRGKTQVRIKFINRQGGFSIKAEDRLAPDELDELSEMVAPQGFEGPSPTQSKHDDDIPF